MSPLLLSGLISRADSFISKYLLAAIAVIVGLSIKATIYITVLLHSEYSRHEFCPRKLECFVALGDLLQPQIEVLKAGAALASLVMLISGAYLAVRSYLASSQVGMLGNAISHVTFFERFVMSEISRRPRLAAKRIDIYAIYELMFPRSHVNERFAARPFTDQVDALFGVIRKSSSNYDSRKSLFKFDDHRRRVISAFSKLHIDMDPSARIDFLETEDEAIDFIVVLCRIFSPPGYVLSRPPRKYR